MSIHLDSKNLINPQQMEIAVNGPDGATHLILCTGVVNLNSVNDEEYAFLVGPKLSRRQFVGVIATGALSTIQADDNYATEADLVSIQADYDEEAGQVKVRAEVTSSKAMTKLGISYSVSILAELPNY